MRMIKSWLYFIVVAALFSLFSLTLSDAANHHRRHPQPFPVTKPLVTGPITEGGGLPFGASVLPLAGLGYVEEEFFFSGMANAYTSDVPLTTDGEWSVEVAATAPYKSRMLVRRPSDPKNFNGIVVVEWLNVSAGWEFPGTGVYLMEQLLRGGYAYVGVSVQKIGHEGFPPEYGDIDRRGALKIWDPVRYGSLEHPGDSYSYDIFSQAGKALLGMGHGPHPLGKLRAKALIATGTSQSATRLNTYINAVQPVADVYDGVMIHVGFGGGQPLSQAPLADIPAPSSGLLIRTDLGVPVLDVEGEIETIAYGGAYKARQPDTDFLRRWEMAGAAHGNFYQFAVAGADAAKAVPGPPLLGADPSRWDSCGMNRGPQEYIMRAAIEAMKRWITEGVPAPSAELLHVIVDGPTICDPPCLPGVSLEVDDLGNALGGVRSTFLDAPIAIYSGAGTGNCNSSIVGSTVFFEEWKLKELYPTNYDYVKKVADAAGQLVQSGFLIPEDAVTLITQAANSSIGR